MNTVTKIGTFEAIAFISIALINRIILNTPNEIISNTASSAWLNVIFISILVVLFIVVIYKLFRNFSGFDLIDVSKYLGGDVLKNIVSIVYIVLYLVIGAVILRNFAESLQLIFLQAAPISLIVLLFIIGIVVANLKGFSTISKLNLSIFFIVIGSFIFIFFSSWENFDFRNLTPILGYGINETFLSGITNLFAYSGLLYLYFVIPFLKDAKDFPKISIISVFISSVFLLISVISLLALFSYNLNTEDMMSILMITRIINFGNIFERLDAIFIFLWILLFLSYLSTLLFFSVHIFKKTFKIKNANGILFTMGTLLFGLTLLPEDISQVNFFESNILRIIILVLVFIVPFIILIFGNFKKINSKQKEKLYGKKC